jgi:hypothetical protein
VGPINPSGPAEVVGRIVAGAAAEVSKVVRPAAAAALATSFGFPLILMVIVIGFLVIQPRLDYRDPKLRGASQKESETVMTFEEEAAL